MLDTSKIISLYYEIPPFCFSIQSLQKRELFTKKHCKYVRYTHNLCIGTFSKNEFGQRTIILSVYIRTCEYCLKIEKIEKLWIYPFNNIFEPLRGNLKGKFTKSFLIGWNKLWVSNSKNGKNFLKLKPGIANHQCLACNIRHYRDIKAHQLSFKGISNVLNLFLSSTSVCEAK